MGQGVILTNQSTEDFPLPTPLAGVLTPGQSVVINASAATLATYGIVGPGNGTLRVADQGSAYTGPYSAAYQGSLNADGSVTGTSSLPEFGDGSDGNIVADGTTTIAALGSAPSMSTYTLTRDVYAKNLTVNSGVTIVTAGFRVFVSETCTNNGTISNNGNAAALGVAGAALTAQTLGASFAGGAGGAAASAGTAGTNATLSGGGAGGAGGAGTGGGSAGAASTAAAPTAAQGGLPRNAVTALLGQSFGHAGLSVLAGGAGGSGGSGDGTGTGGGGGGGGGVMLLAAKALVNAGTVSANGGAGGAGGATNCGGGGGGGGGLVMVVSRIVSGAGSITASGGAAGAKAGTGAAGSVGAVGTVLQIIG